MKRFTFWTSTSITVFTITSMVALAIFAAGLLIFLPESLFAKEDKVNSIGKVQFFIGKDRTLKPVYPVAFEVDQEYGHLVDAGQVLTCNVMARSTPVKKKDDEPATVTETAFRCGDNEFVVKRIIYQVSP